MKTITESKIKLNQASEAVEFCNAAEKCDFDINVFYNRVIIDAKSIIGIMSMDLTKVLTVQCFGKSSEFDKTLKKFAVA